MAGGIVLKINKEVPDEQQAYGRWRLQGRAEQGRAVTLQPQQIDMYACTWHTKEAQRALTSGETHMCKQKQTRHLVPITGNQTKKTLSSRLQAQVQHIISKCSLV